MFKTKIMKSQLSSQIFPDDVGEIIKVSTPSRRFLWTVLLEVEDIQVISKFSKKK